MPVKCITELFSFSSPLRGKRLITVHGPRGVYGELVEKVQARSDVGMSVGETSPATAIIDRLKLARESFARACGARPRMARGPKE